MNEKKDNRGAGVASLVMLIIAILCNIGAFSVPLFVNEQWKHVFEQMDVELPKISEIVVMYASPLYIIIAFFVITLVLILKEILLKNKVATLIFNISGFMLGIVVVIVYWIAVQLPIMNMISSLTDLQ